MLSEHEEELLIRKPARNVRTTFAHAGPREDVTSWRAIFMGVLIGSVFTVSNMYTGLQSGSV